MHKCPSYFGFHNRVIKNWSNYKECTAITFAKLFDRINNLNTAWNFELRAQLFRALVDNTDFEVDVRDDTLHEPYNITVCMKIASNKEREVLICNING